ncbi:hypothetical protein OKA05_19680 [Luteolibacter arcticus]|uniref:Uncharacterized protein n=1 Tax=Luteolibacter arcticus TaxID=1581411 RepID=A0ABT3GMP6_9BACT|nr:hypothetical protein [Luteolibacter arcticus]MCW1924794.1 hypothetical protein [Luteolibacter arcticus]
MAALVVAGGLVVSRCGQERLKEAGIDPGGLPARGREAVLPAKSEERLPSKKRAESAAALAKIKFSLDEIRPDGLRGPDDGLVTVSYEFCAPNDEATLAEVRRIAPGVAIHVGSKGRIGCGDDQALCIGSTHGPDWREELMGLAELGYVVEIRECFFE